MTGEPSKAIEIVEQLEPTTYSAVSLAELYTQAARYDEVISLTEGLNNQDDATALLLVFRGVAFREQGFLDAAQESLRKLYGRAQGRRPSDIMPCSSGPRTIEHGVKMPWPGRTWNVSSRKTPTTRVCATS